MGKLNFPNGPPKDKQATNSIPQFYYSSIATQKSEDQSQPLETTEEIGETSIIRRSSRAKVKTTENSILSNSAEQRIYSNDPHVIPVMKKQVDQNKTRKISNNYEKPNHSNLEFPSTIQVRRLYCWVDCCNRCSPDTSKLDKHSVDHGIIQYLRLVAGCGLSFLPLQVAWL